MFLLWWEDSTHHSTHHSACDDHVNAQNNHKKCHGLQQNSINGSLSPPVFPNGGIPQGTRLSPLLFAILVNGLASFWLCRVKYVDDTTVFEIIPRCSPSYLLCMADHICQFATERGMRLNPKKCREMVINFLQYQPTQLAPLQLMGSVVKRVNNNDNNNNQAF